MLKAKKCRYCGQDHAPTMTLTCRGNLYQQLVTSRTLIQTYEGQEKELQELRALKEFFETSGLKSLLEKLDEEHEINLPEGLLADEHSGGAQHSPDGFSQLPVDAGFDFENKSN